MPEAGWYPDPSGAPRQQRRWDGSRWTAEVRAEPSRRPRPLLWGITLVMVFGLAVWGFIVTDPGPAAPAATSSPTVSAWDETSRPDPSGSRPGMCDADSSGGAGPSSEDPLVNGRLSLPRPGKWSGPQREGRTPLTRDGWGFSQVLPEKLGWASSMTIGLLSQDATADSAAAARTIMQCVLTSGFYTSIDVTLEDYRAEPIRVDNTPAVRADALISFSHPQLTTKGSRLRLVIVETAPDRAFFFSAVPKENEEHRDLVDRAVAGLRVVG